MNLLEILKQFKNIEPDPHFTEKSKRMVLATPQTPPALAARGLRMIFRIMETGAAVVLAGFFILLITGGFQGSHYISPVQYSVIDPQGLHAEAEAVDMQIQLANINYPESAAPESTSPRAVGANAETTASTTLPITIASSSLSNASGTATSTTAPTSTVSIDQALKDLSQ